MHAHLHAHMCTCMHTHSMHALNTCTHTHAHACMHACMHARMHARMHTHTHTHTHTPKKSYPDGKPPLVCDPIFILWNCVIPITVRFAFTQDNLTANWTKYVFMSCQFDLLPFGKHAFSLANASLWLRQSFHGHPVSSYTHSANFKELPQHTQNTNTQFHSSPIFILCPGGTPPEVLNNQELLKLYLPSLKADYMMVNQAVWVDCFCFEPLNL